MASSPITPPARVFYFGPSTTRPTGTVPVPGVGGRTESSFDNAGPGGPLELSPAPRARGVFVVRPSDAEIQIHVLRRAIQGVAARSITEPVVTGDSIFRALSTESITPQTNMPFTELFADRVCAELTGDESLNISPEQLWDLSTAMRDNEVPSGMPIAALLALADQLDLESQAPMLNLVDWLGFPPEVSTQADLRELLRDLARDLRVASVKVLAAELAEVAPEPASGRSRSK
jgi:hypothetical protein